MTRRAPTGIEMYAPAFSRMRTASTDRPMVRFRLVNIQQQGPSRRTARCGPGRPTRIESATRLRGAVGARGCGTPRRPQPFSLSASRLTSDNTRTGDAATVSAGGRCAYSAPSLLIFGRRLLQPPPAARPQGRGPARKRSLAERESVDSTRVVEAPKTRPRQVGDPIRQGSRNGFTRARDRSDSVGGRPQMA